MKRQRIVVAMSGGVDSSTTAALLAKQGHEVIGVTLQLYDYGEMAQKKGACCAGQDIYDAQMVAEKIGIPHYVLNYESVFKESVMEDFAESYIRGETPIPCVKCNQTVKFRDLFKVAKDLGAETLATGHYVKKIKGTHKDELHRGHDLTKDQSYFLFATTQEQLDFLNFPLGELNKQQTRDLAAGLGLEIADKPDSQDICFVPNGNYSSVIERLKPGALDEGEIVLKDGTVVGRHNGIINFTIGQRRGIGVAHSEPLYVTKIDPKLNRVIVGPKEDLASSSLFIKEVNWLGDFPLDPNKPAACSVKLRSVQEPVEAFVHYLGEGKAKVELSSDYYGISPGQACVMYDGSRVLGGGWIARND